MKKDWFCSWFNSSYYPVLYKDRDNEEAQLYIDNLNAINSFSMGLKPGGILVLDYMNTEKIIKSLLKDEMKIIEGITFKITKRIKDDFIIKKIVGNDKGKIFDYEEKVRLITLS